MFITRSTILCTIQILQCICVHQDYTDSNIHSTKTKVAYKVPINYEPFPLMTLAEKANRRYWLVHDASQNEQIPVQPRVYEDEKDINLKGKISTLVQQTMHDSERKMKTIQDLKERHREEAPYRAGFILSMVKKSKDVLDELFNVAVKHKDQWMALEQLKIFELIVHTNVDTTNLLRQLVDVHVKHLNATHSDKKRVILI